MWEGSWLSCNHNLALFANIRLGWKACLEKRLQLIGPIRKLQRKSIMNMSPDSHSQSSSYQSNICRPMACTIKFLQSLNTTIRYTSVCTILFYDLTLQSYPFLGSQFIVIQYWPYDCTAIAFVYYDSKPFIVQATGFNYQIYLKCHASDKYFFLFSKKEFREKKVL